MDRTGRLKFLSAQPAAGAIDPPESQELSDQTIIVAGHTAVVVETDTIRREKNGEPSAKVYCFRRDATRWRDN